MCRTNSSEHPSLTIDDIQSFSLNCKSTEEKNKFSLNFRMTIYEQCLHFLVSSSIFKIGVAVTMFTRL